MQPYSEFLHLGRRRNETHMGRKAPLSWLHNAHKTSLWQEKGEGEELQNIDTTLSVLANIQHIL